jgi:hypothetical protein
LLICLYYRLVLSPYFGKSAILRLALLTGDSLISLPLRLVICLSLNSRGLSLLSPGSLSL